MANMLIHNNRTNRHEIAGVQGKLEVTRTAVGLSPKPFEIFRIVMQCDGTGHSKSYMLELSRNEAAEVVKQLTEGLAGRA